MTSSLGGDDLIAAPRIERRGVFIQEQKLGLEPGRHEEREGLALAAGERADGIVEVVFN